MPLLSKRTRYAFHGLAYLATFGGEDPLPLDSLLEYLRGYSHRLTLSPGYLGKIFQQISRAGLTESIPGPRGGYRLARPADEILLVEVVEALEGPLLTECCLLSMGTCEDQNTCGVKDKVQQAEMAFHSFFSAETLASLAASMTFSQGPPARGKPAKKGVRRKSPATRLPASSGRRSSKKRG
jgi:Rrf2 family iron-sulfur cluster assembly transcriptional regulator